jgi:hypothetical protein
MKEIHLEQVTLPPFFALTLVRTKRNQQSSQ